MKTIRLNIDNQRSAKELQDSLKRQSPEEGDTIQLLTHENSPVALIGVLVIVVVAILATGYLRVRKEETEDLIKNIFDKYKTPEDLEQHIKEKYGIKIEVKSPLSYDEEWTLSSMMTFNDAYANEPDYDNLIVKEPNPDYKPWKKDPS